MEEEEEAVEAAAAVEEEAAVAAGEEKEVAAAAAAMLTDVPSGVGRPAGGSGRAARQAEELMVAARRDLRVWREVEHRSRSVAAGTEDGQQQQQQQQQPAAEAASKVGAGGGVHAELSKLALEARLRLERVMPSAQAKLAEAEAPHAGDMKVAAAAGEAAVAMEARKAAILARLRLGPVSAVPRPL